MLTDRNTGGGRAWQFLCCNAAYRTAWRRRHPQPGLPEQAPFQVRMQTAADLAASRWGLLAWADPDEEDGPISPFWLEAPMLQIAISPDATPLVPGMTALGAPLSGLRLVNGDLVLKIGRGRATTQLRIPAGSGLGPADGVLAQHDILLSPATFSSQLREACALTGWEVPRWGGHGAAPPHRTGAAPQSLRCPGTNARGGSGSSELRIEGRRRKNVEDATPGHGIGFRVRRPA